MTLSLSSPDDHDEATPSWRPIFLTALVAIVCVGGTMVGWSMAARLDSAVVSMGTLIPESERKTVQHLEGGILRALLVRAGERVVEGQIVAELDATQATEILDQMNAEATSLRFDLWRLDAEARGAISLDGADAPEARWRDRSQERALHVAAQQRLFAARLGAHFAQIDALGREIDRQRADIEASGSQAAAADKRLSSLDQEREMIAQLVERGAAARQRLFEFERSLAEAEGDRGEYRNRIVAAEAQIARAQAEIRQLEQGRLVEIGENRDRARRTLASLESRLRAAGDVRERHRLRAPQDGVVVDIRTQTLGAVLAPGAPLMDIVPMNDRLIAEIRLPPEAIDTVHVGRSAEVKLTAYRRSDAPVVEGEVTYVSADLLADPRDGGMFYIARVSLDEADLASYRNVAVSAGMPVEVAINTGARRAADYFLEPLLRNFDRAFREE